MPKIWQKPLGKVDLRAGCFAGQARTGDFKPNHGLVGGDELLVLVALGSSPLHPSISKPSINADFYYEVVKERR